MDIDARFETLEKSLRLHKRLGILAALAVAGALAIAAAAPIPKVIEAQEFVLKDAKGRMRGVWDFIKGGTRFALDDRHGKVRLVMSTQIDGSNISLLDSNNRTRISIGTVSIHGTAETTVPRIMLRDPKDTKRMMLSLPLGRPDLTLYDSSNRLRAIFAVRTTGVPFLKFFDSNKKTIWEAKRISK
jgi:hypothetical protein